MSASAPCDLRGLKANSTIWALVVVYISRLPITDSKRSLAALQNMGEKQLKFAII